MERLLIQFNEEICKYKNDYLRIAIIPYIGVLYNPVISLLQKYVDTIVCMLPIKKKEEKLILLERILKATPKILRDRCITPENEHHVHEELYKTLVYVFPDTIKHPQIQRELRCYKPDIGIRCIKCAIELKYVSSEKEARTFIGEIYEDMVAYDGTEDWKIFYAVIYMTESFITQEQLDSQLGNANSKNNWKVILVNGTGNRIKK